MDIPQAAHLVDSRNRTLSCCDVNNGDSTSTKIHSNNDENSIKGTSSTTTTHTLSSSSVLNQQQRRHNEIRLSFFTRMILSIFRIILMDIPLFIVLCLYVSILYLEWLSINYLIPMNSLQVFDNPEQAITYYHRVCTGADQTTNDTIDLLVDITSTNPNSNSTTKHDEMIDIAVHKMLKHGVTMIPNLISETTANSLREFILEENKKKKHLIPVIENKFRWSFPIHVDQHPIINIALQEILYQPNLVQYMEAVMGPDPAVIEFTAITQAYGAKDQYWHQDGNVLNFDLIPLRWTITSIIY
jgi:hypothetical protein